MSDTTVDEFIQDFYNSAHSSDWDSDHAKAQLRTLIEQQKLEARIDEVEKAVSNFRWGQGTDDLTDRLAELKQKGK